MYKLSLCLIFLFSISTVWSQTKKIILPPMPGLNNNTTLLGVDNNGNGVRDDIEHFIYKNITKDYDVYMAYLMMAQSVQNILVFYPDVEKVKKNKQIERTDGQCLQVIEKDKEHLIQKSVWIVDQTFNTQERKKVDRWLRENQFKISTPYVLPRHINRNEVCRF